MILPTPVVSNTSPLWNLASIERLDLLNDQFSEIFIPREVWQELQAGHEYPEVARIQRAVNEQWIRVESLTNPYLRQSLMLELDYGESAAIALAIELGISQILVDETDARTRAKMMGLHPTGVLGVLLRAKDSGKIVSVSRDMLRLRREAGFFIAESLFQHVRELAGGKYSLNPWYLISGTYMIITCFYYCKYSLNPWCLISICYGQPLSKNSEIF